jgi:hypothetical protein
VLASAALGSSETTTTSAKASSASWQLVVITRLTERFPAVSTKTNVAATLPSALGVTTA